MKIGFTTLSHLVHVILTVWEKDREISMERLGLCGETAPVT